MPRKMQPKAKSVLPSNTAHSICLTGVPLKLTRLNKISTGARSRTDGSGANKQPIANTKATKAPTAPRKFSFHARSLALVPQRTNSPNTVPRAICRCSEKTAKWPSRTAKLRPSGIMTQACVGRKTYSFYGARLGTLGWEPSKTTNSRSMRPLHDENFTSLWANALPLQLLKMRFAKVKQ